jgi:hypothetical protein
MLHNRAQPVLPTIAVTAPVANGRPSGPPVGELHPGLPPLAHNLHAPDSPPLAPLPPPVFPLPPVAKQVLHEAPPKVVSHSRAVEPELGSLSDDLPNTADIDFSEPAQPKPANSKPAKKQKTNVAPVKTLAKSVRATPSKKAKKDAANDDDEEGSGQWDIEEWCSLFDVILDEDTNNFRDCQQKFDNEELWKSVRLASSLCMK